MTSAIANSNYYILYQSNILNTADNIATKNITAYQDSNLQQQNLTLGASSNIQVDAFRNVNVLFNSNNSMRLYNYENGSNLEMLKVENSNNIGFISSSNKPIVIKGANQTLGATLSLTNIQDSNYNQILSTTQSNFLVMSPVILSSNIEWENHVYTTNFNMYKSVEPNVGNSNLSQIAYSFYINDYDQLQLVQFKKYGTSNTSAQVKTVNVFGSMSTSANKYISAASNYINMYTFNGMKATPDPPFLGISVYPNIAVSTRKVVPTYGGYAMRVRHGTNNAQADIAYDDSWLVSGNSTVTITSAGSSGWVANQTMSFSNFFSGANVYVVTFYDQCGGGSNFTQGNTSVQPLIVNAGTMYTKNGMPTLFFNNSIMDSANTGSMFSSSFFVNFVGGVSTNQAYNAAITHTNGSWPAPWDMYNDTINSELLIGTTSSVTGTVVKLSTYRFNSTNGFRSWTYQGSSSGADGFYNGTSNFSLINTTSYAAANVPIRIGTRGDSYTKFIGWMSEIVIYSNTTVSSSDRNIIINSQVSSYSLA